MYLLLIIFQKGTHNIFGIRRFFEMSNTLLKLLYIVYALRELAVRKETNFMSTLCFNKSYQYNNFCFYIKLGKFSDKDIKHQ
jgi:hypothetical protein